MPAQAITANPSKRLRPTGKLGWCLDILFGWLSGWVV